MLGMWEDQVVLVLSSGRRVNVPLNSLNANSRLQADRILTQLKKDRNALAEELRRGAAVQAAPAPDPIPSPPAAPQYQPPTANLAADQAIDRIARQISEGHFVVIYDALPPEYRQQIDALASLTTTKLDPTTINEPLNQLRRIADLVVTRQNWILSHPRLQDSAAESDELTATGETIRNLALPVAGLVRAAIPVDEVSLEKIRETGFGIWLHQRDAAIAPYLAPIVSQYTEPGSNWSVVLEENSTAILEKPGPVREQSSMSSNFGGNASGVSNAIRIELKKVDGFWIPAALAEGFDEWVQQQTAALESHEDGAMPMSDWLGGEYVTAPTAPVAAVANDRFGSGRENNGFDDPSMYSGSDESMEMMESSDGMESSGYPSEYGGASSANVAPKMIEPSTLTPQLIGTILQSIGAYGAMISPLESANDDASFHQAADQLIGPIEGVLSIMTPR